MSEDMEVNNEFSGETGQSDLTLIVEEHKIPVSKAVLCIASPVFQAMLEGDFQEKSMKEIPLPGKKKDDIVEFLRCIYPDKLKKVTEKNVYQILPLAHEYQVKKIEKRCEKVLILIVRAKHRDDITELYRHIQLSEAYFIDNLKKICIYLASEHKLHQFQAAKALYEISDDSHYKIIELALHRRELDSDDDKHFQINFERQVYGELNLVVPSEFSFGSKKRENDTIKFTLTGYIKANSFDRKTYFRALRLSKRYNITEGRIRSKIIKSLKGMSHQAGSSDDEFMDEFNMLPEEIKLEYQNTT